MNLIVQNMEVRWRGGGQAASGHWTARTEGGSQASAGLLRAGSTGGAKPGQGMMTSPHEIEAHLYSSPGARASGDQSC